MKFINTPLSQVLGRMFAWIQATGASIVNFATTATEIVDVSRIF
jgi:hypothetical protein